MTWSNRFRAARRPRRASSRSSPCSRWSSTSGSTQAASLSAPRSRPTTLSSGRVRRHRHRPVRRDGDTVAGRRQALHRRRASALQHDVANRPRPMQTPPRVRRGGRRHHDVSPPTADGIVATVSAAAGLGFVQAGGVLSPPSPRRLAVRRARSSRSTRATTGGSTNGANVDHGPAQQPDIAGTVEYHRGADRGRQGR